MDVKTIIAIALEFLSLARELIEAGVKYGPDIVANFQRAFNAVVKLFSGEKLTEEEIADVKNARDIAREKRREAYDAAVKEEQDAAAQNGAGV
jgi:hypothetical protein